MNLDDSCPFCFGKAKKLLENRFTRQRYPKFFYQLTFIFKGRIFQMLFPSLRLWFKGLLKISLYKQSVP